ncbi:MAG: hypothetical protein F6K11_03220 [Leptolyngbya sp. SIO3F4]|nr:hypothetical protein [Leptolyngbya sp. SIO3F4]
MQVLRRTMTNICSTRLAESRDFYTRLFDFQVDYDSDWFVHLISEDKQLELGIIQQDHAIVPEVARTSPHGFYLTFVVDDVDILFETAQAEGLEVIQAPEDTFYGQRRLLLRDPNGVVVDVSAPMG